MATSRKRTTKPVEETVEAVIENMDEVIEEKVVESKPKKVVKEKKKFAPTDAISCTSITAGGLGMVGIKTRIHYKWNYRGDTTEVEYQDLCAAVRSNKDHIFKPLFIINDADFVEEFPKVKDIYKNMFSINDLESVILDLSPSNMKNAILSLPVGAKDSVKNIASSLIASGRLDSVQKIKTLDSIFDTRFMVMTELYNN